MLEIVHRYFFHGSLDRVMVRNFSDIEKFLKCFVGSKEALQVSVRHAEVDFEEADTDHGF